MSFFTPPETHYLDQYDRSKFKLVWNISLGVFILMGILTLISINNLDQESVPNIIAMGITLGILLVLKFNQKYILVCKIASISSCVLISNTYFFVTDVLHFITPMWMLLNVLFTFFTLGKKWGIVIAVAHFIALCFYIALRLDYNISVIQPLTFDQKLKLVLETIIVAVGLTYLILQFIKSNKYAENNLKRTNESLSRQNKIISYQNEEKNVMLKEIHHRVKNNLQVITSLLRLQSYELENPEHSSPFLEAINRIKSMALIHEKMYQSKVLSTFNFESYFYSLAKELIQAYSFSAEIKLTIESELKSIDSKNIVPISLLFNELISNSIKHAFTNVTEPRIAIRIIKNLVTNKYELYYSDNGTWKENTGKSFGTELINTMTEQLNGEYTLNKGKDGTYYTFTFTQLDE